MTTAIALQNRPQPSPFDSIREYRADRVEFWSARRLMPMLGYEKWERFSETIERAQISAISQGFNVADHFPSAGKMVTLGSGALRSIADVHLTRFACYLVAMNGDPRKSEVAAAQAYFAIKTREAEVRAETPALPTSFAEALELAAAKVRELEAAEAKIASDAPKVEAYDAFMDADGYYSMEATAKILGLGRTTLFRRLRDLKIIQTGSRLPYQTHMHHFVITTATYTDRDGVEHVTHTPRVRPTGIDYLRKRLNAKEIAA